MPRVHHVQKAAKDYPHYDIKKGESYFWWKFRHSGKCMSKVRPRASQLTQSEFLGRMREYEESVADHLEEFRKGDTDLEDLAAALEDTAGSVREIGEECEEKKSNMPDSLQDSDTGQLLEARYEQCEAIASELETAASEIRDLEPDEEEAKDEEGMQSRREQAGGHAEGISWDYE